MTSEGGAGGEDLDGSLFEGMVLFSPTDLLPPEMPPAKESSSSYPAGDSNTKHVASSPYKPTESASSTSTDSLPKSQPLDEDLFSDLNIQAPNGKLHPPIISSDCLPTPSLVPPSRQISRKKKRAVRIGYGREAIDNSAAIPAEGSSFSCDDSTPVTVLDAPCRAGAVGSESAPETLRDHQELHDQPRQEEATEAVQEVASPSPLEIAGDGISPMVSDDTGGSERRPLTVNTSEKEDVLRLIEEKLILLKARICDKLDCIRGKATSLCTKRKELQRRRRNAGEDFKQAAGRYRKLEKELEEACETEDFERAERVSESLATSEKEKDKLLSALREAEFDCDSIDSRMQEVLQMLINAEEEGVRFLEQFTKDAADHADLVHRNAKEQSSKELEEWQSSMELYEMSKLELDIEAELFSDARLALDSSIEDLVKDDRKEIQELMTKRITLTKELDELQKLVRLKEEEIAKNDAQILEVERKVSDVASEFEGIRSRVGIMHDVLNSAVSRLNSERDALSSKKKEIDEFSSLAEQKFSKLTEIASVTLEEARASQDLVRMRKSLASSVLKSIEDKLQLLRTEERISEEIQLLQKQISAARTLLQELSSTRISIQQNMESFKQRIAFIDRRGPELEAEKKVAAAARNFKEAGRIAAEVKTLNSEKENLLIELNKAVQGLEKLEGDMKGTIAKMQEHEVLVSQKEEEAAVAGFKRLRLVSIAARAERLAALTLGDSEEGELLLKEAEAAEERARELGQAYNLNLDDIETMSEHVVSVALITTCSGEQLAEIAVSFKPSIADT